MFLLHQLYLAKKTKVERKIIKEEKRKHTVVCQDDSLQCEKMFRRDRRNGSQLGISVQDDRKYVNRFRAKASGELCTMLH